jgi:hypothetical protein
MMFITSRSRGVKIIGRGRPVVPPLVCRISGSGACSAGIDADIIRPWRIVARALAHVVHGERRDAGQVIEAADVARLHPCCRPVTTIERHLPGAFHLAQEPWLLHCAHFVARQPIRAAEIVRGGGNSRHSASKSSAW